MSSRDTVGGQALQDAAPGLSGGIDWALVRRQMLGVFRMELRSCLLSKSAFVVYFLALAPLVPVLIWAMTPFARESADGPMEAARAFATLFQVYLRTALFLGCLILFQNLFKSEIQERTLHYYYLAPIRREALVVAKYLAGLAAVSVTFMIGTALFYLCLISPWGLGEAQRLLFQHQGLAHLFTYCGIAFLGCVGYGAIFLLAGLVVRYPVVIAVLLWAWELGVKFLPALLKKISIVFYLNSLFPFPVADGPFAIFAVPSSPWVAIPGVILVSAAFLALAGWRARVMEIKYAGED